MRQVGSFNCHMQFKGYFGLGGSSEPCQGTRLISASDCTDMTTIDAGASSSIMLIGLKITNAFKIEIFVRCICTRARGGRETVLFSRFAGCFTFRGDGAGACSVRARPGFRSFLGIAPCLSAWCFLSLCHLSAEAFGGRGTQVQKWRVHCLLDGLMSLAARPFGNVLACIWHWPYVILADWVQVMVDLGRSGGLGPFEGPIGGP